MGSVPNRTALRTMTIWLMALVFGWHHSGLSAPQIGYAYPAGGQRGTSFMVEVGGQSLTYVNGARISGEGIQATVVECIQPLDNDGRRDTERFLRNIVMRQWCAGVMDETSRKMDDPTLPDHPWLRGLDDLSLPELNRLRKRLFDPKGQPNAQIEEQALIEVTIAADAAPGDRELRLLSPDGLSNPLCFQVGVLPEICEKRFSGGAAGQEVSLPALLNGQISPGEVDRIRFQATKGQKLVIRLMARRLIPYLADAVPGWFQATMTLSNPEGEEVAWSDDFRFDPDPLILYEIPVKGVYELAVRDAIYRGREDFVYRIFIGEQPFITDIFPLGVQKETSVSVTIRGWNLPVNTLNLDTHPDPGIRQMMPELENGLCNTITYAVGTLPELTETEPNNGADRAQNISFPATINGRIGKRGDTDSFTFRGKADQTIVTEVYARRLGSPLDSVLRLADSDGTELALNDDFKDKEMGLITHQADSYIRAKLPLDGVYVIHVSDAQNQGGEAYSYRLHVRLARPGFALRLVPSAINIDPGRTVGATIHVLRKDGFQGRVDLEMVEAPAGLSMSSTRIAADRESAEVRFAAKRDTPPQTTPLRVVGHAQIDGRPITSTAVPAEDMMQAFLWRFLVARQEQLVTITGSRPIPTIWQPLVPGIRLGCTAPIRIPLGGTTEIRLEAPQILPDAGNTELKNVQFRLGNRPRGITLENATVGPAGLTLIFKADRNIAMQGDTANAIVTASTEPRTKTEDEKQGTIGRIVLGVLPAIPFEIVQP